MMATEALTITVVVPSGSDRVKFLKHFEGWDLWYPGDFAVAYYPPGKATVTLKDHSKSDGFEVACWAWVPRLEDI